jgi:transposase InsO family protein
MPGHQRLVRPSFISSGKPNENACIGSFNGICDECLNEHWFVTMAQARRVIEVWRVEYKNERRHSSLSDLTAGVFPANNLLRTEKTLSLTADSSSGRD